MIRVAKLLLPLAIFALAWPAAPARAETELPVLPMPAPRLALPAAPAGPVRVAITAFDVVGADAATALGMQLQDGFVLGLARAGVAVLDPADVTRRLAATPELQRCDTSPCLKQLGATLDVRFILTVKTQVTGNAYRMTARLFSTEGATPAALPLDTQSRFCDVCTVDEAREVMIRLADGIKKPVEDAALPPPPVRRRPPRAMAPLLSIVAGAVAIFAGIGALAAVSDQGKGPPAFAGSLVGAGLTLTTLGLYKTIDDSNDPVLRR